MTRSYGQEPFTMPILGGSLPLFHFVEQLGATVITVPTVNADNSQHAPNENLRLRNLWDGIALMTELMTGLGRSGARGPERRLLSASPFPMRHLSLQ
jgi:acetylornithine deacetylase/succinyl-diaminopimelate desuccinylase-like protein